VASAHTAGSLVAALPVAWLGRRIGLKRALICGCSAAALTAMLRALVSAKPLLIAASFAGGVTNGIMVVSLPPMVAALTSERTRPFGFSIFTGTGIATGIL